ncbi:cysteine desulfurase family protein [Numidum massiliense]|uniref:cysteine desulfurase family protein n=1 Tax=Numidum massiliense TaxID=1522315 RepID=UPI0006D55464|nr:cysteine desulfurase family protein [Numidum massiliense]
MIYLDNSATTAPFKEVVDVAADVMTNVYGNPSAEHGLGLKAERLLSQARHVAATQLGVQDEEVIFTSGGTESINLAIKGAAWQYRTRGRHIVTTAVEHAAAYEAFKQLQGCGFSVTYVPTDATGRVPTERIATALRDDTILVSVIYVNNEVGTIQPLEPLLRLLQNRPKTLLHVDAVQAFAKVPLPHALDGIDLLSLSGHKFHAPKGTGLLFVREGVTLHPLLAGGGQENGRRAGTENVPGAVGLARAMQLSLRQMDAKRQQWAQWKQLFVDELSKLPAVKINGDTTPEGGAPHIVSVSFSGLKGEVLMNALGERGVYVSTKSACSTKRHVASRVLAACGLNEEEAEGTIRISMGIYTREQDVQRAIDIISETATKLRRDTGWYEK